jgi:hypothetical protein
MDPPIEDIVAKWVSLAVFHTIQRAEDMYERAEIRHQLELLCKQKNIQVSSLNFSSWSIGKDFLPSYSSLDDLRSRHSAAYLNADRRVQKGLFLNCFMIICDLSSMIMEHQIAADRMRSRKLIGLTVAILSNFHPLDILFSSSLRSVKNLLEADAFHPADLLGDPQLLFSELIQRMIGFSASIPKVSKNME